MPIFGGVILTYASRLYEIIILLMLKENKLCALIHNELIFNHVYLPDLQPYQNCSGHAEGMAS